MTKYNAKKKNHSDVIQTYVFELFSSIDAGLNKLCVSPNISHSSF